MSYKMLLNSLIIRNNVKALTNLEVTIMVTTVVENNAKQYVDGVFAKLQAKNAHQPEFLQAAEER